MFVGQNVEALWSDYMIAECTELAATDSITSRNTLVGSMTLIFDVKLGKVLKLSGE